MAQCDKIGLILKVLLAIFLTKGAQILLWRFGLHSNCYHFKQNMLWIHFGLLFIPISGHAASGQSRKHSTIVNYNSRVILAANF